ncbi:hypothetical protein GYMLUDRAFT_141656, partial [Collybiopsis luxurians FD-317 M1]
ESALRSLSEHNQALRSPSGVNSGFRVPPVRNIISPAKSETVRLLFHGWLRVRDVILTQLNGSSLSLTSKQWRCLLEVCGWKYNDVDPSTATGKRQMEMRVLLDRFCNTSHSNSEDFSVRPVFWGGSSLSAATDFPTDIGREIIWELQELGFRNDLIALDKHVDESKMRPAERRALLNGCWEGTA